MISETRAWTLAIFSVKRFFFSSLSFALSACFSFLYMSLFFSSNWANESDRTWTSLFISSWLTPSLSKTACARDKERLRFPTDLTVLFCKSVFLIFSINSFKAVLFTALTVFSTAFSTLLSSCTFSEILSDSLTWFSICGWFSTSFGTLSLFGSSSLALVESFRDATISSAWTRCGFCIITTPVAKKRVHPKRKCFPFFIIRQFFWLIPFRLKNIENSSLNQKIIFHIYYILLLSQMQTISFNIWKFFHNLNLYLFVHKMTIINQVWTIIIICIDPRFRYPFL